MHDIDSTNRSTQNMHDTDSTNTNRYRTSMVVVSTDTWYA